MKRAINRYIGDFVAIVALVVLASFVSAYILDHQRVYLPAWVPIVGEEFYTVSAEFETAQSISPGQGQTVSIAGVPVGDLTKVTLRDGIAVVEMKLHARYGPIYKDADMLLRPKTALNDMFVQLNPGTKAAGAIPDGGTLPLANTNPNVNPDEIMAMLDADTRDYLTLLVNGGADALRGRGRDLGATYKRFEALGRYGQPLVSEIAKRRRNMKRAIHNFRLVAEELGNNDEKLASWVDSASAFFAMWARNDAEIRALIERAPGAFGETAKTLKEIDALMAEIGPATRDLRPFVDNFGPTMRRVRPFLRNSTPITRDRLRPFAREARPIATDLRYATRDIAGLMPDFTDGVTSLNRILDIMAYNPSGGEEGFLFWLAWMSHTGASVVSMQDSQSPVRRGVLLVTCLQAKLAKNAVSAPNLEALRMIVDLTKLPGPGTGC